MRIFTTFCVLIGSLAVIASECDFGKAKYHYEFPLLVAVREYDTNTARKLLTKKTDAPLPDWVDISENIDGSMAANMKEKNPSPLSITFGGDFPVPVTAGQFPMYGEGNMEPVRKGGPGGGGGRGGGGGGGPATEPPKPHWAVVVEETRIDLDVDSDNNDGVGVPCRSDEEDLVEDESGPTKHGKIVMVNQNDDDRDQIPDYADLHVTPQADMVGSRKEGQFVPLVLELPSSLNLSLSKIVINYDGLPSLPDSAAFAGHEVGNGFRDYRGVKQGKMRIWNVSDPGELRTSKEYIRPGFEYSADVLGFMDTARKRAFYIEGINVVNDSHIGATVKVGETTTASDEVLVTIVAPDLGVNCNNNMVNGDGLRVGIPDVEFSINADDDAIEDQRGKGGNYAYTWWWGRDSSGVRKITDFGLADLSPFTVYVPPEMPKETFRFRLGVSSGVLHMYPATSPATDRRAFLKNEGAGKQQIVKREKGIEITKTPVDITGLLSSGTNELVFKATGTSDRNDVVLELSCMDAVGHSVSVDTVAMTLKPARKLIVMVSARGELTPDTYPTEDGRVVPANAFMRYPDAKKLSGGAQGGDYDDDKSRYLVNVHGYANSLDDAYANGSEMFIRTFWSGYRGNFVEFAWRGDEGGNILFVPFGPNVDNAFRTASSFLQYVRDQLRRDRSASADEIDVTVHSLGNQIVLDGVRIHQVDVPSAKCLHNVTCVEAAIWSSVFWPQENVIYVKPSDPITYTVDELKRNSWAFWFRQSAHPVAGGVGRLLNSYNRYDNALEWMRYDDAKVRNPAGQYNRPKPTGYRIPYDNSQDDTWTPTGGRNLAHQIAAMMGMTTRKSGGWITGIVGWKRLELAQGQTQNPVPTSWNLNAENWGWGAEEHSAHWYDAPLPRVWWWFYLLQENGHAWPKGRE